MRTCSGIRADGGRCKAQPMRDSQYCLNHDPERVEVNRRNSSRGGKRGGRGRPSTELQRLQHRFEELADKVEREEIDHKLGLAVGQLLNYARNCIRDLLTAREQEELIQRLEELEAGFKDSHKGSTRWGA